MKLTARKANDTRAIGKRFRCYERADMHYRFYRFSSDGLFRSCFVDIYVEAIENVFT